MEIRQSYDCLISTMGFHILVRCHLCIEWGPCIHIHYDLSQHIPRNMHMVVVTHMFLCGMVPVEFSLTFRIRSLAMLHNWEIMVNKSHESTRNHTVTKTKQSKTKPCSHFMGYIILTCFIEPLFNKAIQLLQTYRELKKIALEFTNSSLNSPYIFKCICMSVQLLNP